jgi:predicted HicB family RNase H-like nuclease
MGRKASFDGVRIAVNLDAQTYLAARRQAGVNAVGPVLRQWIYNWRSLANLSPYLCERLVHAANERRVDLAAMVNEALTTECSKLPEVPGGVRVVTPMSFLESGAAMESGPEELPRKAGVKVDTQTYRAARRVAGAHAVEPVLRQWVGNWRTLANISPFLYERLVYAAAERRLGLTAMVNEALTTFCSTLPEVPEGGRVVTPMTLVDADERREPSRKAG